MPDELKLEVRGREFYGWKGVQIVRSLFNMSGAFALESSERWPGNPKNWGIRLGDACEVRINKQTMITGYIEDINVSLDDKNHSIIFSGRDKTCDLIDCGYEGSNELKLQTVAQIIENLCSPFGINVLFQTETSTTINPFALEESWAFDVGQSVFENIVKLCRKNGLIPVSYGDGLLTITTVGRLFSFDSLRQDTNIKSASLTQSNRERFSKYIVRGNAPGSDNKQPQESASPGAIVEDSVIKRYRPLTILAEAGTDSGYAQKRGQFEANVRAGKSRALEVTVQGWTQSTGKIWDINRQVDVSIENFGIDDTFIIAEATYSLNFEGTITKMKLVHPGTFSLEPVVIKTGFDPLKDVSIKK